VALRQLGLGEVEEDAEVEVDGALERFRHRLRDVLADCWYVRICCGHHR